jgi:hypothetical protein
MALLKCIMKAFEQQQQQSLPYWPKKALIIFLKWLNYAKKSKLDPQNRPKMPKFLKTWLPGGYYIIKQPVAGYRVLVF